MKPQVGRGGADQGFPSQSIGSTWAGEKCVAKDDDDVDDDDDDDGIMTQTCFFGALRNSLLNLQVSSFVHHPTHAHRSLRNKCSRGKSLGPARQFLNVASHSL
jgi:hypothetical protein